MQEERAEERERGINDSCISDFCGIDKKMYGYADICGGK